MGVPPDPDFRVNWTRFGGYFFFYCNIFDKKCFLIGYRPPPIIGVDGDKVYLDALLYAESFALWFDPNFVEKSRDKSTPIKKNFKKSCNFDEKIFFSHPLKSDVES